VRRKGVSTTAKDHTARLQVMLFSSLSGKYGIARGPGLTRNCIRVHALPSLDEPNADYTIVMDCLQLKQSHFDTVGE
jgi:hypothetical protein